MIKRKSFSKKMKLLIGSTVATLAIVPLVAVSAVACAQQPSLNKIVTNQQIVNALQNYFVKNPNLLNVSKTVEQNNNLFNSPINEINWAKILNYIKSILASKPNINIGNSNYNLDSIGIQTLNKSDYSESNASVRFKLTYNGVPAQDYSVINNLFTKSNFLPQLNKFFTPENIAKSVKEIFATKYLDSTVFQYENQNIFFVNRAAYKNGINPPFSNETNESSLKFINASFSKQKNTLTLNFSSTRKIWIPRSWEINKAQIDTDQWYSLYLPSKTDLSVVFNMNNINLELSKTSMKFIPKNKQAFILNLPTVYYGKTFYNVSPGSFGTKSLPGFPADATNTTKLNLSLNFWSMLNINFSL